MIKSIKLYKWLINIPNGKFCVILQYLSCIDNEIILEVNLFT